MTPRKRTGPVWDPGPFRSVGHRTNVTAASLQRGGVNTAVLRRLVELHCRGWLTRAELEAEFGAPYERLAAAARSAHWRAA